MAAPTETLFREDAYLSTAEGKVVGLNDRGGILLDRTNFYATSGGQPGDTGFFERGDGSRIAITGTITGETKNEIIHVPAPDQALPAVGDVETILKETYSMNTVTAGGSTATSSHVLLARRSSSTSTGPGATGSCACTPPATC